MKKLLVLFFIVHTSNLWSLDISIESVSVENNRVVLDLIFHEAGIVYISEALFNDNIFTNTNVFTGDEYQVFHTLLVKENYSKTLIVSNENNGVLKFIGDISRHTLSTYFDRYLPFTGTMKKRVYLGKIRYNDENHENIFVTAVYVEIAYLQLIGKGAGYLYDMFPSDDIYNFLKISSAQMRLKDALFVDSSLLYSLSH